MRFFSLQKVALLLPIMELLLVLLSMLVLVLVLMVISVLMVMRLVPLLMTLLLWVLVLLVWLALVLMVVKGGAGNCGMIICAFALALSIIIVLNLIRMLQVVVPNLLIHILP